MSMACLVGYLDFAIVNMALPEIQKELRVGFVELQWVMNVFVLALSIFMDNMGRFGDTFGRKPMLYLGLAIFGIASLFSGLASGGHILIVFRALQGIGIAMILPSSLAIISDTFPERERGWAIGIWTSVTGVGLAPESCFGRYHYECAQLEVGIFRKHSRVVRSYRHMSRKR